MQINSMTTPAPVPVRIRVYSTSSPEPIWMLVPPNCNSVQDLINPILNRFKLPESLSKDTRLLLSGAPLALAEHVSLIRDGDELSIRVGVSPAKTEKAPLPVQSKLPTVRNCSSLGFRFTPKRPKRTLQNITAFPAPTELPAATRSPASKQREKVQSPETCTPCEENYASQSLETAPQHSIEKNSSEMTQVPLAAKPQEAVTRVKAVSFPCTSEDFIRSPRPRLDPQGRSSTEKTQSYSQPVLMPALPVTRDASGSVLSMRRTPQSQLPGIRQVQEELGEGQHVPSRDSTKGDNDNDTLIALQRGADASLSISRTNAVITEKEIRKADVQRGTTVVSQERANFSSGRTEATGLGQDGAADSAAEEANTPREKKKRVLSVLGKKRRNARNRKREKRKKLQARTAESESKVQRAPTLPPNSVAASSTLHPSSLPSQKSISASESSTGNMDLGKDKDAVNAKVIRNYVLVPKIMPDVKGKETLNDVKAKAVAELHEYLASGITMQLASPETSPTALTKNRPQKGSEPSLEKNGSEGEQRGQLRKRASHKVLKTSIAAILEVARVRGALETPPKNNEPAASSSRCRQDSQQSLRQRDSRDPAEQSQKPCTEPESVVPAKGLEDFQSKVAAFEDPLVQSNDPKVLEAKLDTSTKGRVRTVEPDVSESVATRPRKRKRLSKRARAYIQEEQFNASVYLGFDNSSEWPLPHPGLLDIFDVPRKEKEKKGNNVPLMEQARVAESGTEPNNGTEAEASCHTDKPAPAASVSKSEAVRSPSNALTSYDAAEQVASEHVTFEDVAADHADVEHFTVPMCPPNREKPHVTDIGEASSPNASHKNRLLSRTPEQKQVSTRAPAVARQSALPSPPETREQKTTREDRAPTSPPNPRRKTGSLSPGRRSYDAEGNEGCIIKEPWENKPSGSHAGGTSRMPVAATGTPNVESRKVSKQSARSEAAVQKRTEGCGQRSMRPSPGPLAAREHVSGHRSSNIRQDPPLGAPFKPSSEKWCSSEQEEHSPTFADRQMHSGTTPMSPVKLPTVGARSQPSTTEVDLYPDNQAEEPKGNVTPAWFSSNQTFRAWRASKQATSAAPHTEPRTFEQSPRWLSHPRPPLRTQPRTQPQQWDHQQVEASGEELQTSPFSDRNDGRQPLLKKPLDAGTLQASDDSPDHRPNQTGASQLPLGLSTSADGTAVPAALPRTMYRGKANVSEISSADGILMPDVRPIDEERSAFSVVQEGTENPRKDDVSDAQKENPRKDAVLDALKENPTPRNSLLITNQTLKRDARDPVLGEDSKDVSTERTKGASILPDEDDGVEVSTQLPDDNPAKDVTEDDIRNSMIRVLSSTATTVLQVCKRLGIS